MSLWLEIAARIEAKRIAALATAPTFTVTAGELRAQGQSVPEHIYDDELLTFERHDGDVRVLRGHPR